MDAHQCMKQDGGVAIVYIIADRLDDEESFALLPVAGHELLIIAET
jgi:hypothetical protein